MFKNKVSTALMFGDDNIFASNVKFDEKVII